MDGLEDLSPEDARRVEEFQRELRDANVIGDLGKLSEEKMCAAIERIRTQYGEDVFAPIPLNVEATLDAVARAALDQTHEAMRRMGYSQEALDGVSVQTKLSDDRISIEVVFDGVPPRVAEYFAAVADGDFETAERIMQGGH